MMQQKVFVSGCYDLLHSGHVAFFESAAAYGSLTVALGSDATVFGLKGRLPVNHQDERLYMVRALRCVSHAFVSSGSGLLDFEPELRAIRPDIFVVNHDGDRPEKRALCDELGIRYVVLERIPYAELPARSTTALRTVDQMPYRIDVAGGWLDQPFVSRLHPGPVIVISLEPTHAFSERSGMATSTRNRAIDLWGLKLPAGHPEKIARMLFAYDNFPGTRVISGSQDAIGIVFPGLTTAYYAGDYWPERIDNTESEPLLEFIEEALWLVPLSPRVGGFDPLADTHLTPANARALADAALFCREAIYSRDIDAFGRAFRDAFEAQIAMFPGMVNADILAALEPYTSRALGWKLSGAGGGGYLIFVSERPIAGALRVRIRRSLE
jgi:cytidyltransferase-like protein